MENLSDKLNNIPEVEFLENRFNFIKNNDLRTNLSISFQYVIFLITIEEELTLQGPVSYSIFKNMVLNTAAIVEGTLHYLLDQLIKEDRVDPSKILTKEEKYSNKKILYKTDDGTEICGIHLSIKPAKLKSSANLAGLKRGDDLFDKKDIQKAFDTASKVLNLVEKELDKADK